MKKNLLLKLFFLFIILITIATVLGSSVSRQHRPLNSLVDVPQQVLHVTTATNGTTSKGKDSKGSYFQSKATEKHSENLHQRTRVSQPVSDDFQNSPFYQTIIDNNLFRPLGWRPSVPPPAYRLLGTIMPSEGDTRLQAIIEAIAGNKTHIAGIGDTLAADIKVVDIQPKQVTLDKSGQQIILRLDTFQWLNAK